MIWVQIIFIFFNVGMAWYHARTFPVKHGLWSVYYLVAAYFATWILTRSTILHFFPFSIDWKPLILFAGLCAQRKVVFDLSLNRFRKKPAWYVSLTTGSILDKVFLWLFNIRGVYDRGLWIADKKRVKRMYFVFSFLWGFLIGLYYL